ncbi:hypothetical protein KQI86_16820 [Clostridium sp. MSJ-11]|uniref:DUF2726 domain-containing protein n=1 Tax=Clostridium mobile TaxID=2841512 RepID=A0ABS6EL86_9CLOT|nr:hypothetical protein [Clostridium mobile]MBU5485986.1 hypothetical protein [Clostridium mobile]
MDILSISSKELKSYRDFDNINTEVDNLNILKYNFKYSYDKEYFNNIVEENIKTIKSELFIDSKEIIEEIIQVIPILNSTPTKEINPNFQYLDDNIKNKIVSYIYWKYKNENSSEKANIQNLKRLLGLKKGKEEYIIPVKYRIKCPKCDGDGIIYIYNYELDCTKYECLTCSHKEERDSYDYNYGILLKCCCKNCMDIKERLYHAIKFNLKNLVDEIKCRFIDEYFKLEDSTTPSIQRMKDDFKAYSSILTKDEDEILSFNPKTINEVVKIIKQIKIRDSKYSRRNIALQEFLEHGVIYHTKSKLNENQISAILNEIIINKFLSFRINNNNKLDINDKIKFLNELYDYLERASFDDFYKIYKGEISFKIGDIYIDYENIICCHRYLNIELNNNYFIEDFVMNTYYTKKEIINSSNELLIKNKIIKSIFKSRAEITRNIISRNTNDGRFVLPNYEMNKLINLECIKQLLSEKEYKYLKGCEVDFFICDMEGYILKAIEVQKGEHHNESEWIWKDNCKKKVFRILGIEFEEYY